MREGTEHSLLTHSVCQADPFTYLTAHVPPLGVITQACRSRGCGNLPNAASPGPAETLRAKQEFFRGMVACSQVPGRVEDQVMQFPAPGTPCLSPPGTSAETMPPSLNSRALIPERGSRSTPPYQNYTPVGGGRATKGLRCVSISKANTRFVYLLEFS